jgi:hypothetical protein
VNLEYGAGNSIFLGTSEGNLVDDERTNSFAQLNIHHPAPIMILVLINPPTLLYYSMNSPKTHSIVNSLPPFLAHRKQVLQIEVPQMSP